MRVDVRNFNFLWLRKSKKQTLLQRTGAALQKTGGAVAWTGGALERTWVALQRTGGALERTCSAFSVVPSDLTRWARGSGRFFPGRI